MPPASIATPAALVAPTDAAIRSGYLEGADRLAHLFVGLSALEEGRVQADVRILQYGDSHTASDTATSVVRRLLQARFGDGGRGFVQIGKPWKTYVQDGAFGGMSAEFAPQRARTDGSRVPGDQAFGLLGVAIEADRRGARAWTRITTPASHLEIDYWQQPAGGSADVMIDGAFAGHLTTRAAQPGSAFFALDLVEAGHEVELTALGDGPVRVFGMTLDRSRAGVVVDALGINGAQVFTPLRWSEEHFVEQLRHQAPDLVVLAYGTNESIDPKLVLADVERGTVELLARVSRAAPDASCLLLGPPDLARRGSPEHPGWATWPPLLDVVAMQRRVARAAGCAFFDQLEAMGGAGSMAAWAAESPPRAQSDRVHLTLAGYAQVGTAFATDLMRAYDDWRISGRSRPAAKVPDVASR
jgi:lysophospholipase L1-like esterase